MTKDLSTRPSASPARKKITEDSVKYLPLDLLKNLSLKMNIAKPLRVPSWILLLIIGVLVVTAYSFVLGGSFKTMDDESSIVNNQLIKDFSSIPQIFQSSFFTGNAYYRPMVTLSYMVDFHFFGFNPLFYYLVNIFLHLASCVTVFFLIKFIFQNRWTAFWVSLLFAIHPVHWEAVSNIPGRAILLCAFFNLNAFLFFCLSGRDGARPRLCRYCFYVLSLLFFSSALLSKESAVVLPVLLLSYRFFLRKKTEFSFVRSSVGILPFFVILGIYVLLRQHLDMTHLFYWRSMGESMLGFGSFLRGVITYLRIFIWPTDLHFDRMQVVFTSFGDPELIGALLFFILIGLLIYRFRDRLSKEEVFFMSWFAIELLPVSQFLVAIGVRTGYISTAEHFLYTPSVGIFVLMVTACRRIYQINLQRKFISPRILMFAAGGYLLFFFLTSVQQNIYSGQEITMLRQTLIYDPQNSRIRNSLGLLYAQRWYFKEAEMEFRTTLSDDPTDAVARIGLGKALCDQGKLLEGLAEYERAPELFHSDERLKKNWKMTCGVLIQRYKEMIQKEPQNAHAHYSLGTMYSKIKDFDAAILAYRQALAIQPDFRNALFNLASVLEAQGKLEEASFYYEKFLSLPFQNDDGLFEYAEDHIKLIRNDSKTSNGGDKIGISSNPKNNAEVHR